MFRTRIAYLTAAWLLFSSPLLAGGRFALGVGANTGITAASDSDTATFQERGETSGYAVTGRVNFTDRWGLQLSYGALDETVEATQHEQTYSQFGLHAVRMWRVETKARPYFKFGLGRTERQSGATKTDGVGPSLGGGVELGLERFAFFVELYSTAVQLEEDVTGLGGWTAGVVTQF